MGPGGALYTIVTLLILGVAIYGQTNMLFWAFGLMIGGLVVSVALSWWMIRGIEVQRLLPAQAVAGETAALRYEITNRKRWMPAFGLVIGETWGPGRRGWRRVGPVAETPPRLGGRPLGWVLHVGPRQSVLAEAPCWPLRRGMLHFERITLSTSFPFGVVRRVAEIERHDALLVYPQIFRMNRRTLFRLTQSSTVGRRQNDQGGGTEEFFGLREYRPGDSLKAINWKRSARTGQLVARELTQTRPPRLMVALDLTELPPLTSPPANARRRFLNWFGRAPQAPMLPYADAERALSLAASLICDAHFHGFEFGLVTQGVACPAFAVQASLSHRSQILEMLALLDLSARRADPVPMPAQPTVVVRTGTGGGRGWPGQVLLHASEFEDYVSRIEGGSMMLLNARAGAIARRQGRGGGT